MDDYELFSLWMFIGVGVILIGLVFWYVDFVWIGIGVVSWVGFEDYCVVEILGSKFDI